MKIKHLFLIAILVVFAGKLFAQNTKEMYPTLGRLLDFDPKIGAEWEKADKIMENVGYDSYKLTKENLKFFKQINYDYAYEVEQGYWDAIGAGCSWYCGAGGDSVTASSYLKSKNTEVDYKPKNAYDLSFKTAWVEGVKGYGIGEYLVYHFPPTHPRITQLIIANGYVKSPKHWLENSRVKKLKMYINDKPFAILNLEDCRREQTFEVAPIGNRHDDVSWEELEKMPKWTLKFEILDVYKGDKYDDTAITEIYFDGIDVHCFGKGTKILMADNTLKNIELIKQGDEIKSYDFATRKTTTSKVSKLIEATHSNLLRLKLGETEILTTDDHSFWTQKNTWAAVNPEKSNNNYEQQQSVEKLSIGDKIFMPEKNILAEIIDIEIVKERQTTYTIEISDNDNFIANGLLVKTETEKR